jgi:hypothetical protein
MFLSSQAELRHGGFAINPGKASQVFDIKALETAGVEFATTLQNRSSAARDFSTELLEALQQ